MSSLPEVLAFFAGGVIAVAACFAYAYRAMGIDIVPSKDEHETQIFNYDQWTSIPAFGASRAGDIIFEPFQKPKAVSDVLGEQLIFQAVCEARNLHSVYVAYAMSDASQRRDCSRDERMFYDACLGATLRGIIDEQRLRTATPQPVSVKNTACH